MRLLIVTQAVDENDPILGFFCRWIEELATPAEHIEVICLKEGEHHLPKNVSVHSLGKEHGVKSPLVYAARFFSLIWRLRKNYDSVFVHMNPEYMILGGLVWRSLGKKITFWYNHPQSDLRLKLGAFFANTVLYTSPYAATAHFKKSVRMPAGVDTQVFKPQAVSRDRHILYMQGRIMPSKRIERAMDAVQILCASVPAKLVLAGPEDSVYGKYLRTRFRDLIASGAVVFLGPKPNAETPQLYAAAGVALNLASAGHYDKSVIEAMAVGTPVIASSKAFTGLIPTEWVVAENDAEGLVRALEQMLSLSEDEYAALSKHEREAAQSESLAALMDKLGATLV